MSSYIGIQSLADGPSGGTFRQSRDGAQVVTDAHGRFHEAAFRNKLFMASNGLAGITSAAAWLGPVAAAAATCLTLWNGATTGVGMSTLQTTLALCSGTVEVGAYQYNHHPLSGPVTATPNAVAKCLNVGSNAGQVSGTQAGNMKGFINTAVTGGLVAYEGGPIGETPAVVGGSITHNADGMIYTPPGAMLTIGAPTNGTSAVIYAAQYYEEIPL
jgi:hypothetical protein